MTDSILSPILQEHLVFSLILKNRNYLFVDGRYTLQANRQSGKNFQIITFPKIMPKNVFKDKKILIGIDPKLFTKKTLEIFLKVKTLNLNHLI